MVTIHCTQKLFARIGTPAATEAAPTTRLGDWHAKPVAIGHQRLILLIGERSRLPVVMWTRGVRQLATTFPDALAAVLWGLGVSAAAINRELDEMREVQIARAGDRSLLGTLNDFAHLLQWQLPDDPRLDLASAAIDLAHTPVQASRKGFFPDQVTRELLA